MKGIVGTNGVRLMRDGTVMTRNLQWEVVFVVVDYDDAGICDRDMIRQVIVRLKMCRSSEKG